VWAAVLGRGKAVTDRQSPPRRHVAADGWPEGHKRQVKGHKARWPKRQCISGSIDSLVLGHSSAVFVNPFSYYYSNCEGAGSRHLSCLDACLGIGLGGVALALGAHRVVSFLLSGLLPLPLFFRFVVLVNDISMTRSRLAS
jgi:hypothetical protein